MDFNGRTSGLSWCRRQLDQLGFLLFSHVLDAAEIQRYRLWLDAAIRAEALIRGERGGHDAHQVVFLPYHQIEFLDILVNPLLSGIVDALLGLNATLYSFSNSSIAPSSGNFSTRIHVDRHYATGSWLEGVGVLLPLVDFREDNGASWWLAGSHVEDAGAPSEDLFYAQAQRLCVPAGSLLIFHPRIWHAGGFNRSQEMRHALTMAFCRPHIKPRLDFLSLLHDRLPHEPQKLQRLGAYAQPPGSLDAFYAGVSRCRDLRAR